MAMTFYNRIIKHLGDRDFLRATMPVMDEDTIGLKLDLDYVEGNELYTLEPFYKKFKDRAHRIDLAMEMLRLA